MFSCESASERILEIGLHFAEVMTESCVSYFFADTQYRLYQHFAIAAGRLKKVGVKTGN